MAKKPISKATKTKSSHAKIIVMVKSEKTNNYVFREEIVPEEEVAARIKSS